MSNEDERPRQAQDMLEGNPSHLALVHPCTLAGHISANPLPLNAALMTLINEQNRMEQIKSNGIFMDATALFSTARFIFLKIFLTLSSI